VTGREPAVVGFDAVLSSLFAFKFSCQASLRVFVQKIFQNKLFGFAGISPVRVLLTNETPFVRKKTDVAICQNFRCSL
jgi:hypothetical protein